jgi:hypothetical protein
MTELTITRTAEKIKEDVNEIIEVRLWEFNNKWLDFETKMKDIAYRIEYNHHKFQWKTEQFQRKLLNNK